MGCFRFYHYGGLSLVIIETAIQILSDMNLYEDNASTPFSITRHKSVANILMERECLRRSFWCTYMFNFMSQVVRSVSLFLTS
jgi:hypothetical protein